MEASERITRKSASNLALAFVLLPKPKRRRMSALYAFCREVDDVADEDSTPMEERRLRLQEWRRDIEQACLPGGKPQLPVNQELQAAILEHRLPFAYFDELIQGVEMDLSIHRYESWEDLELYCYRVASVVGLLSIEIFQYRNPATKDYAVYLGKALQLTNILRDVRIDAERGRVYLPLSELKRHNVSPEEILQFQDSPRFRELGSAVAAKARHYYNKARETLPVEDRRSMIAAELMGAVYWRLLLELEARRFDVLSPTLTRLSKAQKIFLILRTWLRLAGGSGRPNYGQP
jgi:phytoene synthase